MTKRQLLLGSIIGISVTLSVLAFGYFTGPPKPAEEQKAQVVEENTELTLFTTIEGKKISYNSLKDTVILINFWASWCGPCKIEIPELISLKEDYKDKNFEIIGISVDDSVHDVNRFISRSRHTFNYPIVMSSKTLFELFGSVSAVPTTLVLDKGFKAVRKFEGYHPKKVLEKEILPLLND